MSIKYSLITKENDKVLTEFTEFTGNFEQISRQLLKKIKPESRGTFVYDKINFFHFFNQNKLTYMCMTDEKYPKEAAYAFLEEIQRMFTSKYSEKEINNAVAYKLNETFKSDLKTRMEYFNTNCDDDSIAKLRKGVLNMKDDVLYASDFLNQRGEKIQLVISKADGLRCESVSYYSDSKKVRASARNRRIRLILFIVFLILVIGYIISVIACGWDYSKCTSKK